MNSLNKSFENGNGSININNIQNDNNLIENKIEIKKQKKLQKIKEFEKKIKTQLLKIIESNVTNIRVDQSDPPDHIYG